MPEAKNFLISFFIPLILIASELNAQAQVPKAESCFSERPEAYFVMPLSRLKAADYDYSQLNIDRIINDSVFFYASMKDTSVLNILGSSIRQLPAPSLIHPLKMAGDIDEVLAGTAYPTYSQYLAIMKLFSDTYPGICQIDTIGYSEQGRLILAARMSKNNLMPGHNPVVFLSSTMHGDETLGYSLMILLINYILENNSLPSINALLNEKLLIINPLANPDGTYYISENDLSGAIYFNANLVNLNRNFPDPESGPHPDGYEWQEETLAMMDYMNKFPPNLSANLHGGAQVVNYPYDTWAALHPDDAWFRFISRQYADTANKYRPGYYIGFDNGITNGYEWYEVDGGRQDYVTHFLLGRELTIELSNQKTPPESSILTFWNANKQSFLNLIAQAGFGLHGMVYDSISRQPIKAEITIKVPAPPQASVYSDSATGRFFRYAKAGTYQVNAVADNYYPYNIRDVVLKDLSRTNLNLAMLPLTYVPEIMDIRPAPNPFTEELQLRVDSPFADYLFVKIFDLSGRLRIHNFYNVNAGFNLLTVNTSGLDRGLYIVQVRIGDIEMRFKVSRI